MNSKEFSKENNSECFVYVTLPGETDSVTAGRFVVTRDRRGISNGQFVYGNSYLKRANAVKVDPVELRLQKGTFTTVKLDGVFGALRG